MQVRGTSLLATLDDGSRWRPVVCAGVWTGVGLRLSFEGDSNFGP